MCGLARGTIEFNDGEVFPLFKIGQSVVHQIESAKIKPFT
jgi:hypothetical protein